ncbi:hypothetical protein [Sphingomonas elodea]|nr:hypothetical protein [Sphingomonas elodea]
MSGRPEDPAAAIEALPETPRIIEPVRMVRPAQGAWAGIAARHA